MLLHGICSSKQHLSSCIMKMPNCPKEEYEAGESTNTFRCAFRAAKTACTFFTLPKPICHTIPANDIAFSVATPILLV